MEREDTTLLYRRAKAGYMTDKRTARQTGEPRGCFSARIM
jgi:hypothetical protein